MSNNGQDPYGQNPYGHPPHNQYPNNQHPQYGYYQQPYQPPVVYVQPMPMRKPEFNHTPHVIITLLTCGGWLPFWLILWACH